MACVRLSAFADDGAVGQGRTDGHAGVDAGRYRDGRGGARGQGGHGEQDGPGVAEGVDGRRRHVGPTRRQIV